VCGLYAYVGYMRKNTINVQACCHWLVCYVQAKNIDDAFSSCNEVLAEEPDNIDALCDRAETYINNEQYEEGTTLHSDSISYSHAIFHLSLNC